VLYCCSVKAQLMSLAHVAISDLAMYVNAL